MSLDAMQWVADVQVGKASDKAVLVALANFHNAKRNECSPSIDTIAGFTELNRKTVMPALDRLQRAGFISFEKGSRRHRKYVLNFDVYSPNAGTLGKRDNSPNFGTMEMAFNSPSVGTKETGGQSPNTGTLERNSIVPKTTSHSPKKDVLKSQRLDHKQENRINRDDGKPSRPDSNPDHHDPPTRSANPKNVPYLRAAEEMSKRVRSVTGDRKQPNLESWANDIRLLVERDGREPELVWRVFCWANDHDFWRTNILSPGKLRDQFGRLCAQMETRGSRSRVEDNLEVSRRWLEESS